MGAIVVDCSILSSETPKVRFHLSTDTTARDIIRKLLVSFDMASRDPRLFYISMEMTKGSSENIIPGILSLKDENRPLELSNNHRNCRFRIQMRSGGVVKVYDTCLVPNSFYKSMLISRKTSAAELVQLMLNYNRRNENADDFVLVEVDEQHKENRILKSEDLPLLLAQMAKQASSFQLRTAESVRSLATKSSNRFSPDSIRNTFSRKKKTLRFSSDLQHEDDIQEWERDVAIAKLRTNLHQLEKEKGTIFHSKETPQAQKGGANNIASGTKEFLKAKLEKLKLKRKSKKDENDNETEILDSRQNLSRSTDTLDSSDVSSIKDLESKLDVLENSLHGKMELGFTRNTHLRQSLPVRLHADRLSDYIRKEGCEESPERSDLTAQYIERLRRKYTPEKAKALADAKRLVGLSRSASMRSNLGRSSSGRAAAATRYTDSDSLTEALKLDLSSVIPDSTYLSSDRSVRPSHTDRSVRSSQTDRSVRSSHTDRSVRSSHTAREKGCEKAEYQALSASGESGYESRLSFSTYSGSGRSQDGSLATPRGGDSSLTTPRLNNSSVTTPRGAETVDSLTTPRGRGDVSLTTPRGVSSALTTPRAGDLSRHSLERSEATLNISSPGYEPTPPTPRRAYPEQLTPRSQRTFDDALTLNETTTSSKLAETDLDSQLKEKLRRLNEERTKLEQDTVRRKFEIERLLKESRDRKEAQVRGAMVRPNPDLIPSSGLSRSNSYRRSLHDRTQSTERRRKLTRAISEDKGVVTESSVSYIHRKYPDLNTVTEPKKVETNELPEKENQGEQSYVKSDENQSQLSELANHPRPDDDLEAEEPVAASDEPKEAAEELSTAIVVSDNRDQLNAVDQSPVVRPRRGARRAETKEKLAEAKEKLAETQEKVSLNAVEDTKEAKPNESKKKSPESPRKRSFNSFSQEIENLKGAVGNAISLLANEANTRLSPEKRRQTRSQNRVSVDESDKPSELEDQKSKNESENLITSEEKNDIAKSSNKFRQGRKLSVEELLEDVDRRLSELKVKPKQSLVTKHEPTAENEQAKRKSETEEKFQEKKAQENEVTQLQETTKGYLVQLESKEESVENNTDSTKDDASITPKAISSNEDLIDSTASPVITLNTETDESHDENVQKSDIKKWNQKTIEETTDIKKWNQKAVEETTDIEKWNQKTVEETTSEDFLSQSSEDNEEWTLASEAVNENETIPDKSKNNSGVTGVDELGVSDITYTDNDVGSCTPVSTTESVEFDAISAVSAKFSMKQTFVSKDESNSLVVSVTESESETVNDDAVESMCAEKTDEMNDSETDSSSSDAPSVKEVAETPVSKYSSVETSETLNETVDHEEDVEKVVSVSEVSEDVSESFNSAQEESKEELEMIVQTLEVLTVPTPVVKNPSETMEPFENLVANSQDTVSTPTSPVKRIPETEMTRSAEKDSKRFVEESLKTNVESENQTHEQESDTKNLGNIVRREYVEEDSTSSLLEHSKEEEMEEKTDHLSVFSNNLLDENLENMLAEETKNLSHLYTSLADESQTTAKDVTLSQILNTTNEDEVENGSPLNDENLLKDEPVHEESVESFERPYQLREERSESREIADRMRSFRRMSRSDEQWYSDLKKLKNNGLWYGNRDPVPERKLKVEDDEDEIQLRSNRVISRSKDQRLGRRSENLDLHKSFSRREERTRRPSSHNDLSESRGSSRASSRASSRGASSLFSDGGGPRTLEKSREIIAQILSPDRFDTKREELVAKRSAFSQTEHVVQKAVSSRCLYKPSFFALLKECEIFEVTIDTAGYPGHGLRLFESVFESGNGGRSPEGRKPAIGLRQGAFYRLKDQILSLLCVDSIEKKCASLYKGRLQTGDYVVEVNGESCLANDLTRVVAILEEDRPASVLELVIARRRLEDKNQVSIFRYPFAHLPDTDLEKQLVKLQLDAFNMRRDLQQKDKLIDELRTVIVKSIPVRQVKDGIKQTKFNIDDLEEDSFFV